MNDLSELSVEEQELDPVTEPTAAAAAAAGPQLTILALYELRRRMLENPALVKVTLGATPGAQLSTEYTILGDQRDPFNGVAIFNPTSAMLGVGFEAGGGLLAPVLVPPFTMVALPQRFANLSLALPRVGDQQQTYAYPVSVLRCRVPPEPTVATYGDPAEGDPTPVAANPGSSATIGTAGTASVINANPARRKLFVVNASSTGWITLALGSAIPNMWAGIPLAPNGGSWEEELWDGPVSMIAANAGTLVSIAEI